MSDYLATAAWLLTPPVVAAGWVLLIARRTSRDR